MTEILRVIKNKTEFPHDPAYNLRIIVIHDYIGLLINDVIKTSKHKIEDYCKKYSPKFIAPKDAVNELCVELSEDTAKQAKDVYNELTDKVIYSEIISTADSKSEYVITQLFKAFYKHPKQLPDYVLARYYEKNGSTLNRLDMDDEKLKGDPYFIRTICDHIAGMTDQFASREYARLYIPQ